MNFPIIGIGASAGGLEALEFFFKYLPLETGFGYVVMLHLDPTQKGVLPELIQRFTPLPVSAVTDGLLVLPDHVFVLPSNKSMWISDQRLFLSVPKEVRGHRLPFDFFLKSLSKDKGSESIGIILSGMGSDGSQGILSIKENNGLAFIQDPKTCKYEDMPKNAILALASEEIDLIDSPQRIAEQLIPIINKKITSQDDKMKDTGALKQIQTLLYKKIGHDFSNYKKNTLFRRIERRITMLKLVSINEYLSFVQENPAELELLFKELLIGVTQFFRDQKVWEKLSDFVIPDILSKSESKDHIRAWIIGCSTGEEAYSLAMLFLEGIDRFPEFKNLNFQIFATDIDEDAIKKARSGFYSDNITKDVSPARLSRFFSKVDGGYKVSQSLREMVIFAPHNVIKDPPFTKLDLISCRNIMIYLDSSIQKKMIRIFPYCLITNGYLVLGSAETIGEQKSTLNTIDSKLRIYMKENNFKLTSLLDFPTSFSNHQKETTPLLKSPKPAPNIQSITEQLILQKFAPPTVLTNGLGDILYITGHTGKYLEPAAGKASLNLFNMARTGLRHEISIAFRQAKNTYDPIRLKNLKIETNANLHLVDVIIQKLENPEPIRDLFLILFDDVRVTTTKSSSKHLHPHEKVSSNDLVLELQRTREELQMTIDEMQSSKEELKSANEELQSANEEMQSTNEELTSSKEELQSLNEELQSVNNELQMKVDDYIAITNDFKNLLDSTDIATLFLDMDLKIRRFTKQVSTIFNLIPSDIGRPFTDIANTLIYPSIEEDAKSVISSLVFIEKSIQSNDGRWFNIRILPYRTIDDRIIGLVLTFSDISKMKELEISLRDAMDPK